MPQTKHRRKVPVTTTGPTSGPVLPSGSSSNPAATRTVIRRFHVLIKRRTQLQTTLNEGTSSVFVHDARRELAELERELAEMGGLEAYQRMSTIGQGKDRGGGSEKVFIDWLKEFGIHTNMQKEKRKLKLLEVGALKPDNYASCTSWIDNTPVDLHSQHPAIKEQDFLQMDEEANRSQWDLISLSLVVNFVPDARNRGKMLQLACAMLRPEGLLFLALPLPCTMNSRYCTEGHLEGLLGAIGFSIVHSRWKDGGKMAYWLLRKSSKGSTSHKELAPYQKKTVLRPGKRNNFVILLP